MDEGDRVTAGGPPRVGTGIGGDGGSADSAGGTASGTGQIAGQVTEHRAEVDAARPELAEVRDEAVDARTDAAGARDEATDAVDRLENARDEATDALDRVEGARDDAVEAQQHAEESAQSAETAQTGAERARDDAVAVIDPAEDPIVDEEVRHREAGVDEDNPFGRPGRPMSRRSPLRVGFGAAVGAGTAYLLYRALVNAQSVLVLVVVAAFLAIGLNPTVSRLERLGLRRGAAVSIVCAGVLLFFAIVGYAILPPLVEQGIRFAQALPGYIRDLENNPRIHGLDQRFGIIDKVQAYLNSKDLSQRAAANLLGIGSTIAGLIFKGLTILILTLYFLSSFNAITDTAYRMVPRSRRARVTLLGDEILSRVGGYVAGAFVVALIAGTASLVWLSALGVPYPLALALIVMITDIIPLVGATIGAIAVTGITLLISLPVGIATGVFFLVYQQVENYLIYPRVMKRSVDVNPAAAIVGALVGGTLLGIVGALLAVPTTAAIQLILREVVQPRQEAG